VHTAVTEMMRRNLKQYNLTFLTRKESDLHYRYLSDADRMDKNFMEYFERSTCGKERVLLSASESRDVPVGHNVNTATIPSCFSADYMNGDRMGGIRGYNGIGN
jgi:hypothetical protein